MTLRLRTEHPEISPLLRNTIEANLQEISAQPEARKLQDIYAKHLYGIDIAPEVAGYACWNMLFHGDGATNIANADSLNHYGFVKNS